MEGSMNVTEAIANRESCRAYRESPLSLQLISDLCWAAQGITHERDGVSRRAAPSAGATYPYSLDVVLKSNTCPDLATGIYRYDSESHQVSPRVEESIEVDLVEACYNQPVVSEAPAFLAFSAEFDKTVRQYPDHGRRYVHIEAGHIAQNVHLSCLDIGLESCPIGAFDDEHLANALSLDSRLESVYLVAFGYPNTE